MWNILHFIPSCLNLQGQGQGSFEAFGWDRWSSHPSPCYPGDWIGRRSFLFRPIPFLPTGFAVGLLSHLFFLSFFLYFFLLKKRFLMNLEGVWVLNPQSLILSVRLRWVFFSKDGCQPFGGWYSDVRGVMKLRQFSIELPFKTPTTPRFVQTGHPLDPRIHVHIRFMGKFESTSLTTARPPTSGTINLSQHLLPTLQIWLSRSIKENKEWGKR